MSTGLGLAGVLAACSSAAGGSQAGGSSSAPGSASSAAGASSSSAPALAGSPITIGLLGLLSGPSSSGTQAQTVAAAWEAWVNARGGIGGHPVKVVIDDYAGNPATAQSQVSGLINQAHVVAIVPANDSAITAVDGMAIQAQVPIVGGQADYPDWYTKAGLYPTGADYISATTDQLLVGKEKANATKIADLYCAEYPACAASTTVKKQAAQAIGVGYIPIAVSATAASYTAQCLQMQQDGVNYVLMDIAAVTAARLVQDCQAQNYNPTWGTSGATAGAPYLALKNFTMIGASYVLPSMAGTPAGTTFRAAMQQYAQGGDWHEGDGEFAWAGLEVIRQALLAAKVGRSSAVTAKTVTDALNATKGSDFDGVLPNKIGYTAGKPTPYGSHPCVFVVSIKNGQYGAPDGTVCATKS